MARIWLELVAANAVNGQAATINNPQNTALDGFMSFAPFFRLDVKKTSSLLFTVVVDHPSKNTGSLREPLEALPGIERDDGTLHWSYSTVSSTVRCRYRSC
jgi:hypothetical protein